MRTVDLLAFAEGEEALIAERVSDTQMIVITNKRIIVVVLV